LNGIDPKLVVLMIGTNNVGLGDSPDEIAAGIKANLDELRSALPDAKILVMGVPPQGLADDPKRQTITQTNAIVTTFADGVNVFYLDLAASLLTRDGDLLPGAFYSDDTHLTASGYQIWANAIEPLVRAWG
ncbi:MAG TPA: GDSL-type esterase/lipase family protein, partial [Pirellulales bacterium]|nr:GDSL-type esterase/lipase family protein [Pirellulales bacterium]